MSFLPRIKYGINSSRNPGKHWIPGQARNDKLHKTYVVMYKLVLAMIRFHDHDPPSLSLL